MKERDGARLTRCRSIGSSSCLPSGLYEGEERGLRRRSDPCLDLLSEEGRGGQRTVHGRTNAGEEDAPTQDQSKSNTIRSFLTMIEGNCVQGKKEDRREIAEIEVESK